MLSARYQGVSGAHRTAGILVAVALVVLAVVALPYSTQPVPPLDAFLAISLTIVAVSDLFAALVLSLQFRASGIAPLGLLSIAYAATATLVVAQIVAFPDLLTAQEHFDVRAQLALRLWLLWHAVFALLITAYALVRRRLDVRVVRPRRLAFAGLALGVALGTAIAVVAGMLPLGDTTHDTPASTYIAQWPLAAALGALALAAIVAGRMFSALDLWLCVALVAFCGDIVLTVRGGERFSLGWYLGGCYSMLTSIGVAAFFIVEFGTLYARFAQLASIDALTGIPNRRSLDERLDEAMAAAAREHETVGFLMIDIDDFKALNDSKGHFAGDEALRRVAHAARRAIVRPRDLFARYGGEEFAVILPGADEAGIATVAERIRSEVERQRISHDAAGPWVTVSVGGAVLQPGERDARSLIERADAALYRSKAAGKNRITIDEPTFLPIAALP